MGADHHVGAGQRARLVYCAFDQPPPDAHAAMGPFDKGVVHVDTTTTQLQLAERAQDGVSFATVAQPLLSRSRKSWKLVF